MRAELKLMKTYCKTELTRLHDLLRLTKSDNISPPPPHVPLNLGHLNETIASTKQKVDMVQHEAQLRLNDRLATILRRTTIASAHVVLNPKIGMKSEGSVHLSRCEPLRRWYQELLECQYQFAKVKDIDGSQAKQIDGDDEDAVLSHTPVQDNVCTDASLTSPYTHHSNYIGVAYTEELRVSTRHQNTSCTLIITATSSSFDSAQWTFEASCDLPIDALDSVNDSILNGGSAVNFIKETVWPALDSQL